MILYGHFPPWNTGPPIIFCWNMQICTQTLVKHARFYLSEVYNSGIMPGGKNEEKIYKIILISKIMWNKNPRVKKKIVSCLPSYEFMEVNLWVWMHAKKIGITTAKPD